jgi:fused signal recognition particle receptor
MFNFIKNTLNKVYSQFSSKVHALFSRNHIDEQTLVELEQLLIQADTGVSTTRAILQNIRSTFSKGELQKGDDLKKVLEQELISLLQSTSHQDAAVYILVGINGSGKTTFAGKLAYKYMQEGKKVLLVAGDTFRAAATEQLAQWAQKTGADIVIGKENQDPGSVIFNGCQQFNDGDYNVIIIDTAGRLQTKTNLMNELAKIKRIITKQLPEQQICTLLTVDAMLGQNSFEQAQLFHESMQLDGIVLTKMDGTGKGGIVFAINQTLNIPISFITFGEEKEKMQLFNAPEYVKQLLHE